MIVSRTIDMTELEQTRINLVKLCFHLLGFSKEEKARCFDAVYVRLFGKTLHSTIHSDFSKKNKNRKFASLETISPLEAELKGCIVRISDDEIRNVLKTSIKDYASQYKAAAVIQDLHQQQRKIQHIDANLQRISKNEWEKNFKQLQSHVTFTEKRKLLAKDDFSVFMAAGVSYVLTMLLCLYVMSLNIPHETDFNFRLRTMSPIGMTVCFLIIINRMKNTLIHRILYENHNHKVEYGAEHIDEQLNIEVYAIIEDYYAKKHVEIEKLQARLAAFRDQMTIPDSSDLENDTSDTELDSDSDEEKTCNKREKIKRRPAYCNPKPAPEMKKTNKPVDTLFFRYHSFNRSL